MIQWDLFAIHLFCPQIVFYVMILALLWSKILSRKIAPHFTLLTTNTATAVARSPKLAYFIIAY